MSFFSSNRERRFWLLALAILVAIYSTLGLTPTLAGFLRDSGLIIAGFWLGLILVGVAVLTQALKARPRGLEIGVGLGIAGAYVLAFIRLTIPEERTHLIEYSVLALFIFEALKERMKQGRRVPVPALLTIAATALLGLLDEGIQAILPNRVFDLRDVGFNALAGLMAVTASLALAWARRWRGRDQPE